MAEFSAVKAEILSELMPNSTTLTSLDTAVSNAMIQAIQFHQLKKFTFNQSRTTINFIPNDDEYSITSTYVSMTSLFVADTDNRIRMYRRPLEFVKARNADNNSIGTPRFWAPLFKNSIAISPFPDVTATASAYFHSRLSSLSGGGSAENDWLNDGLQLVKARAKILVSENVTRDFGYAANQRVLEREILDELNNQYEEAFKSNYIPNYYENPDFYYL